MQAGRFRFDSRLLLGDMKKFAPRAHLQKKDGSATSDRDTTRMRDSLPVAHVPCVRALRGSTGRVGVAAAFQRRHGRIVTAAQVIASNGPPCALLHPRRSPLSLVGLTAAGHAELLATRLSRAAMTVLLHLDVARPRLLISRAGDALRDPWCLRSGSLTGSPRGCHCVRRGSNFENLNCNSTRMDVVTTAVPSADVASDASRHL